MSLRRHCVSEFGHVILEAHRLNMQVAPDTAAELRSILLGDSRHDSFVRIAAALPRH